MKTMKELAEEALAVQDACNLLGVAHAFSRAMANLRELGLDLVALRDHPITVLWVNKLEDLVNSNQGARFGTAYEWVRLTAKGVVVEKQNVDELTS